MEHDFEKIRKEVDTEYRKRRDDIALREYIERLKDQSEIIRADL